MALSPQYSQKWSVILCYNQYAITWVDEEHIEDINVDNLSWYILGIFPLANKAIAEFICELHNKWRSEEITKAKANPVEQDVVGAGWENIQL